MARGWFNSPQNQKTWELNHHKNCNWQNIKAISKTSRNLPVRHRNTASHRHRNTASHRILFHQGFLISVLVLLLKQSSRGWATESNEVFGVPQGWIAESIGWRYGRNMGSRMWERTPGFRQHSYRCELEILLCGITPWSRDHNTQHSTHTHTHACTHAQIHMRTPWKVYRRKYSCSKAKQSMLFTNKQKSKYVKALKHYFIVVYSAHIFIKSPVTKY